MSICKNRNDAWLNAGMSDAFLEFHFTESQPLVESLHSSELLVQSNKIQPPGHKTKHWLVYGADEKSSDSYLFIKQPLCVRVFSVILMVKKENLNKVTMVFIRSPLHANSMQKQSLS